MSKQLQDKDGVTITSYYDGKLEKVCYQVTWGLDKYESFEKLLTAQLFSDILISRIK